MDGKFTRKDSFVSGGHTTDPPESLTYSRFSRNNFRIAFTIVDLKYIDTWACDIEHTYLNEKFREKILIKDGTKFENYKGKVMIVIRAMYGLKSIGASWIAMLAETILDLGCKSSRIDMDVWSKLETNTHTKN